MRSWVQRIRSCLLLAWVLLLAGCLPSTPPPEYYSLAPLSAAVPAPAVAPGLRLGVVFKAFPEALERPQILTRDGFRVELAEQHRWAAPLRQETERVLTQNLGRLLGTERVALAPWPSYFSPTRRLVLEVLQFDGSLCGELVLQARWALTDAAGTTPLMLRDASLRETVDCSGYAGYAAAQSRALARLAAEVSQALTDPAQP